MKQKTIVCLRKGTMGILVCSRRSKVNFMCNKLIPAKSFISGKINRNSLELPKHTRIGQNLTRGGIEGLAVPVCLSVCNFSTIPTETEWYP